ncbi:CSMD [Mytilus edulis]|uniref:CSMD n=1 Tax=Mytilus edulis TaxID=6550 RepID=A0A8S3UAU0_MYTED|nr:CSMD [Mytilus edulis]
MWNKNISHHNPHSLTAADEDTKQYIQWMNSTGNLKNTVLVIMSDQGPRSGQFVETDFGRMTSNYPLLSIYIPHYVKKAFPTIAKNLNNNENRLTTPFDLHETLKDIIFSNLEKREKESNSISSRGVSLFREISKQRSCYNASIGENYCPCYARHSISPADETLQLVAEYAVNDINLTLKDHRDLLCITLKLMSVKLARAQYTFSLRNFRSDTSYTDGPFSGNRWLYFCMKFTKVTDNLFYFYLLSDVDNTILPNERVFNPPENSIPDDSDPLCSTFCQYTSEPKIRTLQKTEVIACPDLAPVNFTTITAETGTNYQDNITYACNTGYELKSGDLIRECLADESWSGSPPVCEVVACPDLAPVNFATITAETGKNYQGTITYACTIGYELKSGDLTRQCQDDKAWSGSPPVCEVVACPDLAPVNFATITAETGKNYQSTITYACNKGYELKSGDRTRQCQDDKAWSGSPPVCEVVACPDLAPVNFATITAETGINYQGTITYACNTGYELKSGDLTRQCQDDKTWSESPPVCEIVACPDLAPVNFATITAETGKNYQGTITYDCNTGYELKSGDLTRQCQDDKTWSGSPPQLYELYELEFNTIVEIVACPDLAPVHFATITAETGKNYQGTITYACNTGYELKSGDLTRQCQDDKTWSGSPPVCEVIACPDLAPVHFATITAETGKNYQGTITYACTIGFELKSGDLTRQCQYDKTWSGSPQSAKTKSFNNTIYINSKSNYEDSCKEKAVACPDLRIAPINFATITAETGTSYQDTITYACNTGYKLKSGNLTRECLADGSWSGGPPVCAYSTVAGHAFTATLPLGYTPVSIGSPIKYTLINSASIGSEYNAATGIYTVAKPGIYLISVSMMSGLLTASHLTIRKNADVLVWLYTNNDYDMASQTININLAANDKISVVVNSGSSLFSVYNTFSVFGPIE